LGALPGRVDSLGRAVQFVRAEQTPRQVSARSATGPEEVARSAADPELLRKRDAIVALG